MKKNYTALYIPEPASTKTKGGFSSPREAQDYITKKTPRNRESWIVVETSTLKEHLEFLNRRNYGYQE